MVVLILKISDFRGWQIVVILLLFFFLLFNYKNKKKIKKIKLSNSRVQPDLRGLGWTPMMGWDSFNMSLVGWIEKTTQPDQRTPLST